MTISGLETNILYKKYLNQGLTTELIKENISRDKTYLKELAINLRSKGHSEDDLNLRFKEEFAKLIIR